MEIQTIVNLQSLINSNPNIEVIEIWDKILYLRMKKGRNVFHTKKGITKESNGIYVNLLTLNNDYKSLQFKYHPDRNSKYLEISQSINQWKDVLSECFDGSIDRNVFTFLTYSYPAATSIFSLSKSKRNSMEEKTRFYDRFDKDSEHEISEEEHTQFFEEFIDFCNDRVKTT